MSEVSKFSDVIQRKKVHSHNLNYWGSGKILHLWNLTIMNLKDKPYVTSTIHPRVLSQYNEKLDLSRVGEDQGN